MKKGITSFVSSKTNSLLFLGALSLIALSGCSKLFETSGPNTNRFTSPDLEDGNGNKLSDKPFCAVTSTHQGWHTSSDFFLEFNCDNPRNYPDDDVDHVLCRDSASLQWDYCDSTRDHLFSGMSDGSRVLEIKAITIGGRESPVRRFNLKVDSNSPTITNFAFDSWNANRPRFNLQASDPTGGSGIDQIQCQIIGPATSADWWVCGSGSITSLILDRNLSNGEVYTINVKARDRAANESQAVQTIFTVHYTAPAELCTIAHISTPTRLTSQSVNFQCNSAHQISRMECRLNLGTWETCTSPKTYSSLPEGTHNVEVRFQNAQGFYSIPQQASWTVDLSPPSLQITQADTDGVTAQFRFNTSDNDIVASTECSVHQSTQNPTYRSCTDSYTADGLQLGKNYVFMVKATDRAGNITARSHLWNTTPPAGLPSCVISSTFPNGYSTSASTAVQFICSSSSGSISYPECKTGNGNWGPCSSQTSHVVDGLADGDTTQFCVRSHDAWLRESSPSCVSWKASLIPPQVAHLSVDIAHPYARLNFQADTPSCPVTSFECKLDGPNAQHDWQTCTNPKLYSQLVLMKNYTFQVRAKNLCNQTSPAKSIVWSSQSEHEGYRCYPVQAATQTWHQQEVSANIVCDGNPNNITLLCSNDGSNWATCQSPLKIFSNTTGEVVRYVRGRDDFGVLGPISTTRWYFDFTKPTATIHNISWASNLPTFTFEGNDVGSGIAKLECMIEGISSWATCVSPQRFTQSALSTAGRSFTFKLRSIDKIGQISNEVTRSWTNGNWSNWASCARQSNGSGLQTRTCSNPAVANGGLACAGAASQACTPPPPPPCTNGATNSPTCTTCPSGQTLSSGKCVAITWGPVVKVPATSVYSQRRQCNFAALCTNISGWVNYLNGGTKFAHLCVKGGRGYWSSNHYGCLPPVGFVDTGHRCNTTKAVVRSTATGSGLNMTRYNALRTAGAPLPAMINPHTRTSEGIMFANDAATRLALCQLNGYQRVVSYTANNFRSPKDNAVMKWNSSLLVFQVIGAKDYNNWLSALTCGGRLDNICVNEWQWIFRK